MSYEGIERRKNRIFPDVGDIRCHFGTHPYLDIHQENIDIDKKSNCFLITKNAYGMLGKVQKFHSVADIFKNTNISCKELTIGSISAIFGANKETIYNIDSNDKVLISIELVSGEIFFLESSINMVEQPENMDGIESVEGGDKKLIPETKHHFIFLQEWLSYQDQFFKKIFKQQDQKNAAV